MIIFRKIPPYLIHELSNSESHDPKWTRQLGVCVLEFVDKYIETVDVENGISNTDFDIANDIFRCFNINFPSTHKIRKKVLENMFTDWMGAEFTQGVAFGQFIELEMLYSYDEFLSSQENKPLLKVQQIVHRRSKQLDGTLVPRYCKILGSPAENEGMRYNLCVINAG